MTHILCILQSKGIYAYNYIYINANTYLIYTKKKKKTHTFDPYIQVALAGKVKVVLGEKYENLALSKSFDSIC